MFCSLFFIQIRKENLPIVEQFLEGLVLQAGTADKGTVNIRAGPIFLDVVRLDASSVKN